MQNLLNLPTLASEHGGKIDEVIVLTHIVIVVSFLIWGVFFAIPLLRYRKKVHPKADYAGLKSRVPYVFVALMAVVEAVLLVGWSLPFWDDQVYALPDLGEDYTEVHIIAQQFQWSIHYPGPDGVFGRTANEFVDDQSNIIGLDRDDPAAKDDITSLNLLYLPVDKLALIHLTSKDMVHGFFLPEFRVKQDIIPGMSIPVHFKPTMTTEAFQAKTGDPERDFQIACAQLCGLSHFDMRGTVKIVSPEEFQAWLDEKLEQKRAYEEDDDWF